MAISCGRGWFRFLLLLMVAILIGAAIGIGWFSYEWKSNPRYTAVMAFSVLPPQESISGPSPTFAITADDSKQIIARQQVLFEQDAFLEQIMKDDDFRRDHSHPDDPKYKTKWLTDHGPNPVELKKDLVLVPKTNASAFEIRMTTTDPLESFILVKAAAKVYLQYMQESSQKGKDARRRTLEAALDSLMQRYNAQARSVKDYASSKGIDVLNTRIDIEKLALEDLNSRYRQLLAQAETAEASYTAIAAQRKDWLDGKSMMKLSPEMEESLSHDPELLQLEEALLSGEQNLAAEQAKPSPDAQRIKELAARKEKMDEQISAIKEEQLKAGARRMEEAAHNQFVGSKILADKYRAMQETESLLLSSLSQDMMDYQQKLDDLKAEYEVISQVRLQARLAEANRASDDTRVSQLTDMPAIPMEHDGPYWYNYFLGGGGAGLLLALLLWPIAFRGGSKKTTA